MIALASGRLLTGVVDDSDRCTCLVRSGALTYVCAQQQLHEVTAEGAGNLVFELDEPEPPPRSFVPDAIWGACRGEWLDFADHGGLETDTDTEPRQDDVAGCSISRKPGGWPSCCLPSAHVACGSGAPG